MDDATRDTGEGTPPEPAAPAEEATRREAAERLAALLALAPGAALLFDPRQAEAFGDGSFDP